jgi:betaine-aldehyde dehydrogenase
VARLIVEESIRDEFIDELLVGRAGNIRVGGLSDADANTGSLICVDHRDQVEKYVEAGQEQVATLRVGGRRPDDPELDQSFYLPTFLDRCTGDMSVAPEEESLGPVRTLATFSGTSYREAEDRAFGIANHAVCGLAGAAWTETAGRAERTARGLRHGTVRIKDYHPYMLQAELGEYKQSGIGRELGLAGLQEYRDTKHFRRACHPHGHLRRPLAAACPGSRRLDGGGTFGRSAEGDGSGGHSDRSGGLPAAVSGLAT